MNAQQSLDFLFQIVSNSPMTLAGHMQAQKAYQNLKDFLTVNAALSPPPSKPAEKKKGT